MSRKRIISLIATAVGIYLIIYSIHSMNEISDAKGFASDLENFFTHNPSVWDPLVEFFGGKAQEEVSKYDVPVMIMLISGIVLTIGGVVTTILWWKKPEKR